MKNVKYWAFDLLSKEQKKKFNSIKDNELYEVIKDYQGGSFGMGRAYTIKQWIDQALEWLDSDGYFEKDQEYVNWLLDNPNKALESIGDFWSLGFAKVEKKKLNDLGHKLQRAQKEIENAINMFLEKDQTKIIENTIYDLDSMSHKLENIKKEYGYEIINTRIK